MRTVKSVCLTMMAALLLAAAPASHAQSQNDLEMMQSFLSLVTEYLEVVDATHEINANAEKAAILQMQKIREVYEERGEKARAAEVFRQVLNDSRNPAIRSAAYVFLGDILKETGRSDEAVKMLQDGLSENIKAAN